MADDLTLDLGLPDLDFTSEWSARIVNAETAEKWLKRFHYLGTRNTSSLEYGVFGPDMVALVSVGNPGNVDGVARRLELTDWPGNKEITRVAVHTEAPANAASRAVAVVLPQVAKQTKVDWLFSYADLGQNHHGGIYQALNAVYCGVTMGTTEELQAKVSASDRARAESDRLRAAKGLEPLPESGSVQAWKRKIEQGGGRPGWILDGKSIHPRTVVSKFGTQADGPAQRIAAERGHDLVCIPKGQVQWEILEDGEWKEIHSRTIGSMCGTSHIGAIARLAERGIKIRPAGQISAKHTYILPIGSKRSKAQIRKHLKKFEKPYPKREQPQDDAAPDNSQPAGGVGETRLANQLGSGGAMPSPRSDLTSSTQLFDLGQERFDERWEVRQVNDKTAEKWLDAYHYTGTRGSIGGAWGVFAPDLLAVVEVGSGVNPLGVATRIGLEDVPGNMEVTRVAVHPKAPKNTTSRAVAAVLKVVASPKIQWVFSYADTGQNHHGGIYQALNAIYVGLTEARAHSWVLDGEQIHMRNIKPRFGSHVDDECIRRAAELGHKLERVKGLDSPKHTYIIPIGDKRSRALIRQRLAPQAKPYPKRKEPDEAHDASARRGLGDGETPVGHVQPGLVDTGARSNGLADGGDAEAARPGGGQRDGAGNTATGPGADRDTAQPEHSEDMRLAALHDADNGPAGALASHARREPDRVHEAHPGADAGEGALHHRPLEFLEQRRPAIEAFVNEIVTICVGCGKPVRRNQSRRLINQVNVGGNEEIKHEMVGGDLVHWECA